MTSQLVHHYKLHRFALDLVYGGYKDEDGNEVPDPEPVPEAPADPVAAEPEHVEPAVTTNEGSMDANTTYATEDGSVTLGPGGNLVESQAGDIHTTYQTGDDGHVSAVEHDADNHVVAERTGYESYDTHVVPTEGTTGGNTTHATETGDITLGADGRIVSSTNGTVHETYEHQPDGTIVTDAHDTATDTHAVREVAPDGSAADVIDPHDASLNGDAHDELNLSHYVHDGDRVLRGADGQISIRHQDGTTEDFQRFGNGDGTNSVIRTVHGPDGEQTVHSLFGTADGQLTKGEYTGHVDHDGNYKETAPTVLSSHEPGTEGQPGHQVERHEFTPADEHGHTTEAHTLGDKTTTTERDADGHLVRHTVATPEGSLTQHYGADGQVTRQEGTFTDANGVTHQIVKTADGQFTHNVIDPHTGQPDGHHDPMSAVYHPGEGDALLHHVADVKTNFTPEQFKQVFDKAFQGIPGAGPQLVNSAVSQANKAASLMSALGFPAPTNVDLAARVNGTFVVMGLPVGANATVGYPVWAKDGTDNTGISVSAGVSTPVPLSGVAGVTFSYGPDSVPPLKDLQIPDLPGGLKVGANYTGVVPTPQGPMFASVTVRQDGGVNVTVPLVAATAGGLKYGDDLAKVPTDLWNPANGSSVGLQVGGRLPTAAQLGESLSSAANSVAGLDPQSQMRFWQNHEQDAYLQRDQQYRADQADINSRYDRQIAAATDDSMRKALDVERGQKLSDLQRGRVQTDEMSRNFYREQYDRLQPQLPRLGPNGSILSPAKQRSI